MNTRRWHVKKVALCIVAFLLSGCVNYDVEPYEAYSPYIAEVDLSELNYAYSLEQVEIDTTYHDVAGKTIQDLLEDKKYMTYRYGEVLVASDEQQFLELIEIQLHKLDPFFGIYLQSDAMPLAELEALYKKLMNTDDQISATLLGYSYSVERVKDGIFIEVYNAFTTSIHEYRQVGEKMDELIKTLDIEGLSPYDKVKTLYAYVMERMTYNDLGTNMVHSPMGFLFHGEGVCQAYAVSLHMLLERAGIESRYIIYRNDS